MLSSNKTLAKNTIFLYVRTLVTMVISLYTSRVILNTLGVMDYGIYSIVGSVLSMIAIINTLMSLSNTRFITYEIGRGDKQRLKDTFSSAMIGEMVMAGIIVFLLETVGLYLLNNKLVIPEDRMFAAHVVYHLSVFAAFINCIQQPYGACVTAHEHFGFYANIEILSSVLKLVIVFLLLIGDYDKLILYGVFMVLVTIAIALINFFYCHCHFAECHLPWKFNRDIFVLMLKYSTWSMYGNIANQGSIQGTNLILNIFFGPIVNAANSIALTVQGILTGFSFNVITSFRSQIVKSYAAKEYKHMVDLIYKAGKYATMLYLLTAIPLFIEVDYVLCLWLGKVPEYSALFLKWLLVANIFFLNYTLLSVSIGATGKVMLLNLWQGSMVVSQVPIVYFLFKFGYLPSIAYIMNFPIYATILIGNLIILQRYVKTFSMVRFVEESFIKNTPLVMISIVSLYMVHSCFEETFVRLSIICITNVLIFGIYFYIFYINKDTRRKLYQQLSQLLIK